MPRSHKAIMSFSGRLLLFLSLSIQALLPAWAHSEKYRSGGRTREYDFCITWEEHAPDGFSRPMLLVNGHSPGPVVEADQDDWVIVRVTNKSPYNTTIHWHGIEMHGTPWSDGVPGVTQRAIQPGCDFTYEFRATEYGSYWYHSHFHGQIEDGLYGPIVVHPRRGDPKPFYLISNESDALRAMKRAERKVKPLVIADFMHLTSTEKWDMTVASEMEDICYDSILFNGKGRVYCLSEQEIASHLTPGQIGALSTVPGATMTDKGCFPPEVIVAGVGGGVGDVNALLPGTYSGCEETQGSTEVITTGEDGNEWMAMDLVGAVNFITGTVSIDEHDMWVYAVDGAYIEPQKVQALALGNGERYSIMVRTTQQKAGKYKIRCYANGATQILIGHAVLDIQRPGSECSDSESSESESDSDSEAYIDINGRPLSPDVAVFNQTTARPFPPQPIAKEADATYKLNMRIDGASYLWALNSTRLMPAELDDMAVPVLFYNPPHTHHESNVTFSTLNGTWIDLVLVASVPGLPSHPIHKHGNKMFRLGAGTGVFRWSSVAEAAREQPQLFNLVDPPRRDTFETLASPQDGLAWTAVRYQVTNPGAWLLHCHINNHLVGGMAVVIQDGVDEWPTVPQEYLDKGL